MLSLFGTTTALAMGHEFWWLYTGYGYGEDLVVAALTFCLPALVLSVVFARLARRAPVLAETRSHGVRAMWWSAAWWLVLPTLTSTIMCMVSQYSSGLYWLRWFGLVVPVALMVVAAALLVRDWRRRCGPPANRVQVGVGVVALVLFGGGPVPRWVTCSPSARSGWSRTTCGSRHCSRWRAGRRASARSRCCIAEWPVAPPGEQPKRLVRNGVRGRGRATPRRRDRNGQPPRAKERTSRRRVGTRRGPGRRTDRGRGCCGSQAGRLATPLGRNRWPVTFSL
ncbi:hypothetical protein [Actinocatenispora thailandica]|nr:hypothetical protein [Actinocatenispora thailandica]